ncbi:MAG: VOC family protein [Clostridiales bacterium]|jgi:catechol 2,3-dioxygenase-like lactoylglutathione lyase family enzyme|nr:VOC family protein [Clostridiales bacterium]
MKIIGFHHIAVDSMDTERSRKFYQALGGRVLLAIPREDDGGFNYQIEIAPGYVIEIQPPRSRAASSPAGWNHIAFQTDDCAEACKAVEAAGGIVSRGQSERRMMGTIPFCNAIVSGPDGERIELLQLL